VTITVLGATGRTGRRVVSLLMAEGRAVRAVVRRPEDVRALTERGVEAVRSDLTAGVTALAAAFAGSEAVVNAAGVSSLTSPELLAVDRDGAICAVRAAQTAEVPRFVQISAMPADRAEQAPLPYRGYLRAKNASDTALAASGLVWTVVRPGGLHDRPGKGRIRAGAVLGDGSIARDDLAAVVVACLEQAATRHRAFDVVSGRLAVDQALASLTAAG
jgi:uncharacterized protein YbjT (DUF2867 family)